MSEQSQFAEFTKRQLVYICERLIDKGFDTETPYYSYYKNLEMLENVVVYFGVTAVFDEDVQFFAKFIDINDLALTRIISTKDKSSYENLVIPTAKRYSVEYHTLGTCSFREEYETYWDCYDKDWVIDSIEQMRGDGNWDLYEGKHIDTDYDNHDTHDWSFDKVREVNENLSESKIKNSIVDSLDKKTLLELRGLIDKKLRQL